MAVSQAYINKIMSDNIVCEWYGTITTSTHTYDITDENIKQSSSRFIHDICAGSRLEIGNAFAKQLNLDIYLDYDPSTGVYYLNGIEVDRYDFFDAVIDLKFRLYLNDELTSYEDVNIGEYTVDEAERTADVLYLKSYDSMVKFNKIFDLITVATPYYFLNYVCQQADVVLGNTQEEIESMPNGTASIYPYEANSYVPQLIDVVGYIASLLCGNAFIANDNKLYIRQYSMNVNRTISSNWRYSSKIADYEIYYNKLTSTDLIDNEELNVVIDDGKTSSNYDLGANPFLQGAITFHKASIGNILNELHSIVYTPFEITVPIDPSLSVLDVVELIDGQAVNGKYAGITSIEYSLSGSMTLKSVGENPTLISRESSLSKSFNQISELSKSNQLYYYAFTNLEDVEIGQTKEEVISVKFVNKIQTTVIFQAEIKYLLESRVLNNKLQISKIKVTYFLDNVEIDTYYPEDINLPGEHILNLLYIIPLDSIGVKAFKVKLELNSGSAIIKTGNANGIILGKGLEQREEWDGILQLSDSWTAPVLPEDVSMANYSDAMRYTDYIPVGGSFAELTPTVLLPEDIGISSYSDDVTSYAGYRYDSTNLIYGRDVSIVDGELITNYNTAIITTPVTNIAEVTQIHVEDTNATYLVSFDGGTTYMTYDGADWVESSASSMTKAVIEAITDYPSEINGVVIKATITPTSSLKAIWII